EVGLDQTTVGQAGFGPPDNDSQCVVPDPSPQLVRTLGDATGFTQNPGFPVGDPLANGTPPFSPSHSATHAGAPTFLDGPAATWRFHDGDGERPAIVLDANPLSSGFTADTFLGVDVD